MIQYCSVKVVLLCLYLISIDYLIYLKPTYQLSLFPKKMLT